MCACVCTSVTGGHSLVSFHVAAKTITHPIRKLVVLTIFLWVEDVLPAVTTGLKTHKHTHTQTTCDMHSLLSHTLAAKCCCSHDLSHCNKNCVCVCVLNIIIFLYVSLLLSPPVLHRRSQWGDIWCCKYFLNHITASIVCNRNAFRLFKCCCLLCKCFRLSKWLTCCLMTADSLS